MRNAVVLAARLAARGYGIVSGGTDTHLMLVDVFSKGVNGKTAEEGVASLKAEVARMRDASVSAQELEEARNELITAALLNRETSDGRADELARSVILYKDPQASDKILAKLQTVTAEDIQRVARTMAGTVVTSSSSMMRGFVRAT